MERNGKLVIIGPAADQFGTPLDAGEIPHRAAFFIGWTRPGEAHRLLDQLQLGTQESLAVYGLTSATRAEVNELRFLLRSAHIRDGWFEAWTPLVDIVRILQWSAVADGRSCDRFAA